MKNFCEEEVATDSRNQGIFRQASAIPASRQGSSAWSPGLDWATVCRVEFLETVMETVTWVGCAVGWKVLAGCGLVRHRRPFREIGARDGWDRVEYRWRG